MRVALVYRDMRLTYRELNEKSNALANILRKTYKDRTGSDIASVSSFQSALTDQA